MAYITVPGWPNPYPQACTGVTTPAFSAKLMDASGEKVAFVIRCPKDGTLNRVGFRLGTVGVASLLGLDVSFQDVGGDGKPDGVQDQIRNVATGSLISNTWIETGLITSDGTDTGTKRTVVTGELLAIVIDFNTFVALDSLNISANVLDAWTLAATNSRGSIYSTLFAGAAWGARVGQSLNIALQYSDNVFTPIQGCLPVLTINTHSFAAASNPDERGMKFTCPVAMRAVGFWIFDSWNSTGSTAKLHLYDNTGNGVELASTVTDPDINVTAPGLMYYYFDSAVADSYDLATGAVYTVSVEATGAANYVTYSFLPNATTYNPATPWGENATYRTRQNAGAWTEDTTGLFAPIGLLISAIDPVKAGGTILPPWVSRIFRFVSGGGRR